MVCSSMSAVHPACLVIVREREEENALFLGHGVGVIHEGSLATKSYSQCRTPCLLRDMLLLLANILGGGGVNAAVGCSTIVRNVCPTANDCSDLPLNC